MFIQVKNLGKIKSAQLEIKPLTIFVGKNGTQKSYMAHIVYGVYKYIFGSELELLIKDLVKDLLGKGKKIDFIYKKLLNHFEKKQKLDSDYIYNLFNSNKFQDTEVRFEIKNLKSFLPKKEEKLKEIFQLSFYFPSSRTGFVLAFDEILTGLFRSSFGTTTTRLTQPVIDFLTAFADIKTEKFKDPFEINDKDKIAKAISFINERILKGKILEEKKEDKYKTYFFQPFGSQSKLDLHITSSATIELLPLVVFLKNFNTLEDKLFIIEEPEAHLHPKAQLEMARLIVLLVNYGAKVLITTHSDFIINELNNLIKLYHLREKDKNEFFEFLKSESLEDFEDIVISENDISVYLFKEVDDYIDVKPLNVGKFGIEDENFEEVIDELFDKSTKLGELIGE